MAITRYNDSIYRVWNISQIDVGLGVSGPEQFLPHVDDTVIDHDVGVYRVAAVDPTTNIAVLEVKIYFNTNTTVNNASTSLITALMGRSPTIALRCFFNFRGVRGIVRIDDTYWSGNPDANSMRLFLGTDTSDATGTVISGNFNANGALISDKVNMIAIDPNTPALRSPAGFESQLTVESGIIVTGLIYDTLGNIIGSHPFISQVTDFMMPVAADNDYLTGIRLVSMRLDPNDDHLIRNIVGVPFSSSEMRCRLLYTSGAVRDINIDGNKCILHHEGFDTSYLGRPKEVVLTYYPDANERYINGGGSNGQLSELYRLANVATEIVDTLKVFVVPEYANVADGFTFKWYLTNLKGDLVVDVTNDINVVSDGVGSIRANDYGVKQRITLSVDADTVAPGVYPGHTHVQVFDLILNVPGVGVSGAWIIDYQPGADMAFGADVYASATVNVNGKVNIANGKTTLKSFVALMYDRILPLYDTTVIGGAVQPTHYFLEYKGTSVEVSIANFAETVDMPNGTPTLLGDDTLVIRWISRSAGNDNVLGWSPLNIVIDL